MAESKPDQREGVAVQDFAGATEADLALELLHGQEGVLNLIRSPRIQNLGLALAGFTGCLHPHHIRILRGSEVNYLMILDPAARGERGDLSTLQRASISFYCGADGWVS